MDQQDLFSFPKGQKNEIIAELSNHLVSDEHQKKAIKSQLNSPKSSKSQDSQLDSLLQSDAKQKQTFYESEQNEEDSKDKNVQQSKTSFTVSVPQSKITKDGALVKRYWGGFHGRKSLHGKAHQESQSGESPIISQKGGKEADYFKQKDRKLLAQDDIEATFEGEWLNQKRDGYGIQIWPDGTKYQGYWSNNKACGQGSFFHVDGDKYTGHGKLTMQMDLEFMNKQVVPVMKVNVRTIINMEKEKRYGSINLGMKGNILMVRSRVRVSMYGQIPVFMMVAGQIIKLMDMGEYRTINGPSFKGHWRNNDMHGFGIYKWQDGRIYEGEYLNDKKHGYGKYSWRDGRYYEGQWTDGKQDGMGKYVLENCNERMGIWINGKRLKWVEMTDHQKPLDSTNQQKSQDD